MIDSAGGGRVVLGGTGGSGNALVDTYAGGTRVLSGVLELVNSSALPTTGVLTVAGPGSIVSIASAGTVFESDTVGQVVRTDREGIASSSPAVDAFGSPVPEPLALVLLGGGAIGLLGYGWRRRKAK